jgi:hypothetical protein
MKVIGITSTAIQSLLLGVAPAYAQQGQRGSRAKSKIIPNSNRTNTSNPSPNSSMLCNHRALSSRSSTRTSSNNMFNSRSSTRTSSNNMFSSRTRTGSNSMPSSSGAMNKPSALRNSSESSRAPGSSIAHKAGSQTTEIGNSVAATTATASLMTGSVDTLARSMGSESTVFLSWLLAGTLASSTAAIGLVPLTHGQNTGRIIGTTPTTSMSPTPTTAITCSTAGIPMSELRSASRCSGVSVQSREKSTPDGEYSCLNTGK